MSNLADPSLFTTKRHARPNEVGYIEVAPDMGILLAEVLLPILERVNASLDELEQAVARIAEAPHG